MNGMMIRHLVGMAQGTRDLRHKRYLMGRVREIMEDRSGEIELYARVGEFVKECVSAGK